MNEPVKDEVTQLMKTFRNAGVNTQCMKNSIEDTWRIRGANAKMKPLKAEFVSLQKKKSISEYGENLTEQGIIFSNDYTYERRAEYKKMLILLEVLKKKLGNYFKNNG